MFHQCKLVHADLSEYNILYHDSHLYIIDVSQSVEHDHPSAFDFLRKDIKNVEEFFGRLGVKCLGLRRCFEFVTKDKISETGPMGEEEDAEVVISRWMAVAAEPEASIEDIESIDTSCPVPPPSSAHEDSVFLQSYIPRSLNELYDPERDVAALNRGEGKELIYAETIGLVKPSSKEDNERSTNRSPVAKVHFEQGGEADAGAGDGESGDGGDSDDEQDEESSENGKEGFETRRPRGHRHEDREAKKVNKTQHL